MLLRTTDPVDAGDEKKLLDWFVEVLGTEDARTLVDWVWSRERATGRYVAALAHIMRETAARGVGFAHNLLVHARRPSTVREMEEQLMATMTPHVEKARVAILGHRGDPPVVEESMRELRVRLRETIRRMWPEKHRATIDGAIVVATQVQGGSATIDFGKIVEALLMPDPLAVTATASHAVSEDR